jgi:hypothetical protein
MPNLRQGLTRLTTAIVFLSTTSTSSQAQALQCSKINYVGVGCATFRFVGVERGKPFTAQRVVIATTESPEGGSKTVEWTESVSRDSAGRIRFEQTEAFKPPTGIFSAGLTDHEIEKIMVRDRRPDRLVIIFDCFSGKSIVLEPNLKVANVMQTCDTLPPFRESGEPYSQLFTRILSLPPRPEVSVEDLGYHEVQSVGAHGLRRTGIGSEKDGEWNGKPIAVNEQWMSEDLGATVTYVHSDLRKQTESRSTLTNIKRGEPDSGLFEIPPGYTIKPSVSE